MTSGASRLGSLACWAALPLLLHLGCAGEVYVEPVDAEEEPGDTGKLGGLGGSGTTNEPAGTGGSAGKSSGGSAGRGGSSAGKTNGGSQNGGKSAGGTGTDHGGEPGETTGGTSSGSGGAGGGAGSGGGGGSLNQPAMCDEATATVLGSMNANVAVASNVCLKMTVAADQTWVKKITMQPEGGQYPLPFTWSNCGTNSSGAFTANYGNQILTPVNLQCPILVKLGGSGSPVNVQWWGG